MKVNDMIRRLTRSSDLQDTALPGVTVTEIADDKRVLIENHRGVIRYTGEMICIRTKFGQIQVDGCGMKLAMMSRQQLVITGTVACVKLIRG